MSVPSEAQGKKKFEVIMKSRSFTASFMWALRNNNVFKRENTGDSRDDEKRIPQPELVSKIRDVTLDAFTSAFSANEIKLTKGTYEKRKHLIEKSINKYNELLALIELSIPVFHLPMRRVENWTRDIVCVRNMIQKWKESDYSRYRKM